MARWRRAASPAPRFGRRGGADVSRAVFGQLASGTVDSPRLGQEIGAHVDEAGKEASAKRDRLRQLLDWSVDFYRELMRVNCGAEPRGDASLVRHVNGAARNMSDAEIAAACLARCLESLEQLDRNANTSTLLACWLDDMERLLAPAALAK